jgi:nitrite reductase/ring-hydroxylating ferredoxin subunit
VSTTRVRETRLPVAEAPGEGDVRMVEIDGHRIGLYRVGDELHALADRCPHRGAPICAGRVVTPIEVRDGALELGDRASVLRCPWHKWEFAIASGRCLVDERMQLRRYAVKIDGDEVVVSLDRPS